MTSEYLISVLSCFRRNIAAGQDLSEAVSEVVDRMSGLIRCDGAAVYVERGNGKDIIAEKGLPEAFPASGFGPEMPLMCEFKRTGGSIHTGNVYSESKSEIIPATAAVNSILCAPVMVSGEILGFVYADSVLKDAFTGDDLSVVEILAGEVSFVLTIDDLSEQVKSLVTKDRLTGCFTLSRFSEDFGIEIACSERYSRPLSLLLFDLDWFNAYNQLHGREKGDEVLRRIADVLALSKRECDRLYRYGGEEFVIMLPGIDRERAVFTAQRLKKILGNEKFEGEEKSQPFEKLTVSIGIASFPADSSYSEGVIRIMKAALECAKKEGKNRICAGGCEGTIS